MAYKFFFTKNPTAADPPNWKHVVSNEEEEKQLKAFSCSECGYTIFPARGREGKFFPDDYKCGMCGAGRDAFEDRIDEIREGVEKGREGGEQAEVVYEDKDKYSSPRREKTEKTEESEDGGSGEAWAKAVEEGEPDVDVEREVELAMEKEKGEGKDEGGGLDLLEMD
jgi:rubredoxin